MEICVATYEKCWISYDAEIEDSDQAYFTYAGAKRERERERVIEKKCHIRKRCMEGANGVLKSVACAVHVRRQSHARNAYIYERQRKRERESERKPTATLPRNTPPSCNARDHGVG